MLRTVRGHWKTAPMFQGAVTHAIWNKTTIFTIWRDSMWAPFVALQTLSDFVPDTMKHVLSVSLQSSECSFTVDFSHRRLFFIYPQLIESSCLWSGLLGDQFIGPVLPVHWLGNLIFRACWTVQKKLVGAPSCWKIIASSFLLSLSSICRKEKQF